MKVEIRQIGFSDYQMDIYHIWKLFYEEVELVYEPADDAELRMTLELADAGEEAGTEAEVRAYLERPESGAAWSHTERRLLRSGAAEARRRELKRVVGSALLRVLEEASGLEQPWGVLTGVRPTKLMHNMVRKQGRELSVRQLQEEYLLTDEKAKLLADIVERQLKVIPDLFELDREVSLYIGIPFCPTKCAYCTFPAYDIRGNNGSVDTFLDGLHYEIRETGEWLKRTGLTVTTIYWGGGTPTSITAEQIDALFETMHQSIPDMDQVRELTVEAGRPDTITPDKLKVMKKWNVDRISINPQSFTQLTLDKIGRHHTVDETIEKFILSREMGMDNINMDLIIGLPNEGIPEFQHTLDETAKLLPESLTVHTLSFKRASRMTKNRDQYEVAERDEIADMMKMANRFMAENGYHPYYMYRQKNMLGNLENVGYALGDRDSLYNILMMEERQTIIGLGCGAVSKVLYPAVYDAEGNEQQKIERFPNPKEPSVYNQAYKEYFDKKMRLLDDAYGQTVSG
ncbi:coproporphyrinogen III oxidase [Paenibacillus sp. GYB004]|uniref:coproporphyrinogen III oxidase n=1 Tax=Paenibacillus sp. GYB004 TaxID=2994393 RepID=UPI002F96A21B